MTAWLAEQEAFYEASLHDDPSSTALLDTLVKGGPVAEHAIAFLAAQAAAGVEGPSTWRIGNVRVVTVGPATAIVQGCSFDQGSHYAASGASAPADLGGGAGYTAYVTTMHLIARRWYVFASAVTAPRSSAEAGPCHGF